MRPRDKRRTGKKQGNSLLNKVLLIMLVVLVLFTIAAPIVEAKALDSVKATWGNMKKFVKSGAFWVNTLIIFGIAMVLFSLTLAKNIGSDNTTKILIYIVIGILALIIASKIVAPNGAPDYIWKNTQFTRFTQFLIGPPKEEAARLGACAAPTHSAWRAIFGIEPNPPCCGDGAYETLVHGNKQCKQALLRTNENGSGLPVLILSTILFFLLFRGYGEKLGINSIKWLPLALALVLGALVTNQRITKNNLIIIAGWAAVILIGNRLSRTTSQGGDVTGSRRGFGFGLAFAFVQLIANMLGTSLFGGSVDAGEIGINTIIWNIFWGFLFGFIYSIFVGEGILGRIMGRLREEQRRDVEQQIRQGSFIRPFLRSLPLIGRFWRTRQQAQQDRRRSDVILEQLRRVEEELARERGREERDPRQIRRLEARLDRLERDLMQALGAEDRNMNNPEVNARPDQPGEVRRQEEEPGTGPPERPDFLR